MPQPVWHITHQALTIDIAVVNQAAA